MVALVQSNSAVGTGLTSQTVALGSNSTAGNILIATVACKSADNSGYAIPTPSGWTLAVKDENASNTTPRVYIFYKENVASAPASISVDYPGATPADIATALYEFPGIATSASLDKTASSSNSTAQSALTTGTTATTAQADELVIAMIANRLASTAQNTPVPSDFTQQFNIQTTNSVGTSSCRLTSHYKTVAITGAYTLGMNCATARQYGGAIATFKVASAGTTKTVTAVSDAVLAKQNLRSASMGALLQKTLNATPSFNAVLAARRIGTSSLNAILAKAFTRTSGMDAALLKTLSRSTSMSAALQKAFVVTLAMSALVAKTSSASASFNAVLAKKILATLAMSAAVQKKILVSTLLDAMIEPQTQRFILMAAVLAKRVNRTLSADAVISITRTKTPSLNAVVAKQRLASLAINSMMSKRGLANMSMDCLLESKWVRFPDPMSSWQRIGPP